MQAAELWHLCSRIFHGWDCPYRFDSYGHRQPALACSNGCTLCPSMGGLSLCLFPSGAESSLPSSPMYPCLGSWGTEHAGTSGGVWKASPRGCAQAGGHTVLLCPSAAPSSKPAQANSAFSSTCQLGMRVCTLTRTLTHTHTHNLLSATCLMQLS